MNYLLVNIFIISSDIMLFDEPNKKKTKFK